jgi:hypothetical protein
MKNLFFLVLAAALMLTACSSDSSGSEDKSKEKKSKSEEPETKAEPVAEPMDYQAAYAAGNNDKLVSIEGYLQMPSSMYTSNRGGQLNFYSRPDQHHGQYMIATIKMGDCNNCMAKVKEKYTPADLKVKTTDGAEIGGNSRVKLTGRLRVSESTYRKSGLSVSMTVDKIEKADEVAIDYTQLGAVTIDKTTIRDSSLKDELVYATGKLSIPMLLFMDDDVSLDLTTPGGKLNANFVFGKGPNQIQPIPKNYKKTDIKVMDHTGKVINLAKPVKIWGTRSAPSAKYNGTIYVERLEQ